MILAMPIQIKKLPIPKIYRMANVGPIVMIEDDPDDQDTFLIVL
jgi:hypothetical protein